MYMPLVYQDTYSTSNKLEKVPWEELPADYQSAVLDLQEEVQDLFFSKLIYDFDWLMNEITFLEERFEEESDIPLEEYLDIVGQLENLQTRIKIREVTRVPKTTILETAKPIKEASALAGASPSWWEEQHFLENSWRMG